MTDLEEVVAEAIAVLKNDRRNRDYVPSRRMAVALVREAMNGIVERAKRGNFVRVPIGTFRVDRYARRTVGAIGSAPPSEIPERRVLKFRASKALRRLK